jgi:hypothetical protein
MSEIARKTEVTIRTALLRLASRVGASIVKQRGHGESHPQVEGAKGEAH